MKIKNLPTAKIQPTQPSRTDIQNIKRSNEDTPWQKTNANFYKKCTDWSIRSEAEKKQEMDRRKGLLFGFKDVERKIE